MTVNIGGKHVKRGEQEVTEKKKAEENGDDNVDPSIYSCEIVLKNTTLEKQMTKLYLQMLIKFGIMWMEKRY